MSALPTNISKVLAKGVAHAEPGNVCWVQAGSESHCGLSLQLEPLIFQFTRVWVFTLKSLGLSYSDTKSHKIHKAFNLWTDMSSWNMMEIQVTCFLFRKNKKQKKKKTLSSQIIKKLRGKIKPWTLQSALHLILYLFHSHKNKGCHPAIHQPTLTK